MNYTHIDLFQSIKESLQLPAEYEVKMNMETGREEVVYDEDLDEDKNSVFSRLPHDMTGFLENITTAQGCLLLLVLREHLKVPLHHIHAAFTLHFALPLAVSSEIFDLLDNEASVIVINTSQHYRSSMGSMSPRYPLTRLQRVRKFTRGQSLEGLEPR